MNSLNRLVLPVEYPSQTTKVLVINIFGKANGLTGSGIFSGARIFAQTLFRLLMTTYRPMLAYGFLGGLTISSNLLVNPKYDNLTEGWLKPSN